MQVKDVMSSQPISIAPAEPVAAAARLLAQHNIGALPVCSGGQLRGMVTDRDIVLRCVAAGENPGQTPVQAVMTRRLITVAPEDPLPIAAQLMAREQVRRLPVAQGRRLIGMVSLADLAAQPACTMEAAGTLAEISAGLLHRT